MTERKQTLVWPCAPTGTQYGENGPRLGDEVQERLNSAVRNLLISYLCVEDMLRGSPY